MRVKEEKNIVDNIIKELKSASDENIALFIQDVCKNLTAYNKAGYFEKDQGDVRATIVDLKVIPGSFLKRGISKDPLYVRSLNALYENRNFLGLNALSAAIEARLPILQGVTLPPLKEPEIIVKPVLSTSEASTHKEGNPLVSKNRAAILPAPAPTKSRVASTARGIKSFLGWTTPTK